ncbi:MAG: hypothetical protein A2941_01520 [Candidatus Yanofskybacteria bacterium RIFCSPLOWO2_01_FULL_49_17]|uniref:Uncharacterized protein n=1 Tax=Candidatus Yanofskybacteria bacterium RIFCSPLOWO2_01_FULL_49_17 TaxID=1802700 RepID=A0A1F8GT78_9BACT|nr:MAG: hypothetical protein A2941_01520 [Candidatus Yanofskybacteria bacterium RIFCSPLOWO2_01_FULL_49_17]
MRILLTASLLFVAVVIAEGMILPAFFNIYGTLLGFVFLVSLLVVYGNMPTALITGSLVALMLELWRGFDFGSATLSFLAAAATWQVLTDSFDITPFIGRSRLYLTDTLMAIGVGYTLFAVTSAVFLVIEKYIYRIGVSWQMLGLIFRSPAILLAIGIGMVICVFLLRLPGQRAMPLAGKFYI